MLLLQGACRYPTTCAICAYNDFFFVYFFTSQSNYIDMLILGDKALFLSMNSLMKF
jgi:hypothetical protein